VFDDVKFVTVVGRRGIAVSKPDYPGFDRVIEPLIPNKQTFGNLFMENSRMRSAIDMVSVNPSGVEGRDCGALRIVAALHYLPTPPESRLGCA
jgi:hypothetical protein